MSLFKPFLAGSHLLSPVAPLLCLQDHGNPNNSLLSSTGLAFIYILMKKILFLYSLSSLSSDVVMMLDDFFYILLLCLLDPVAGPQAPH